MLEYASYCANNPTSQQLKRLSRSGPNVLGGWLKIHQVIQGCPGLPILLGCHLDSLSGNVAVSERSSYITLPEAPCSSFTEWLNWTQLNNKRQKVGVKMTSSRHVCVASCSWLRPVPPINGSEESCFLPAVGEGNQLDVERGLALLVSYREGRKPRPKVSVCRGDPCDLKADIRTVFSPLDVSLSCTDLALARELVFNPCRYHWCLVQSPAPKARSFRNTRSKVE